MATSPKSWPESIEDWPANNSNAAMDRDDAAMSAAYILQTARRMHKLLRQNRLSREESLDMSADIAFNASDILRLLERNGAPTRPSVDGR